MTNNQKCIGCSINLEKLNKIPSNHAHTESLPILLCDECIERLKIPILNILAITKSTDVNLYTFIQEYMS
jgi:hypothetical protein